MIIITIDNITPRFTQTAQLDGLNFTFAFEWNDRSSQWTFSISDQDLNPLVHGVPVSVGIPLLNRHRDERLPLGFLEAIDTSDLGLDPGFNDLGQRVQLAYTPAAEIPAAFR